jgi:hypothetical protein
MQSHLRDMNLINMSDEIINKVITISSVEQKTASNGNPFFKLKDENGLTYTMWTTKKDGTEQKCFSYFKTLGLEATGKTVSIGIKEDQGDYNGKPVTYRTIIGMRETSDVDKAYVASQTPQAPQASGLEDEIKSLKFRLSLIEGKLGIEAPKQPLEAQISTNTAPPAPTEENVTVEEVEKMFGEGENLMPNF